MHLHRRFHRPHQPSRGLELQERDIDLLKLLAVHRYARSEHVHQLLFSQRSIRIVQARLRQLWEHGLLDRYFLPVVIGTDRPIPRRASQPIYALTARGAAVLAEKTGAKQAEIPYGLRRNLVAFPTLLHDLVATDFTIALRVAVGSLGLRCTVQHDHALRALRARFALHDRRRGLIVPDAAVTIAFDDGRRLTLCLEVVRAGIRGGNRGLRAKLANYLDLHRRRFFRDAYGHEWLRAVVIATTSSSRAEGLRSIAGNLPHGHRLFWFGSYRATKDSPTMGSDFTPESILDRPWRCLDGSTTTLRQAIHPVPYDPTLPAVTGRQEPPDEGRPPPPG